MADRLKGVRAEVFLAATVANGGFESTLEDLKVIQAGPGRVVCRLHAGKQLQNRYGTLHGGCIATLVDVIGSAALVTQSDRAGVSLAINTLYLNPMPGGEEVEVDARIIKLGRDVATMEVTLKRVATGDVVATGTHVKKLVAASDLGALFQLLDEQDTEQQREQQHAQPGRQQQQQQQQQHAWQEPQRPRSKL